MEPAEIRLRLIEAAAKNPTPHKDGYAAGVLATATEWEKFVKGSALTVPQKEATSRRG
jgi:hypothetical protein